MPNPTKIVDEEEVLGWFEDGWTYPQMVAEYKRKYNISTSIALWSNFRSRHGIPRRIVRDDNLLPWAIKEEHRWLYPAQLLRFEARKRALAKDPSLAGKVKLSKDEAKRLADWHAMLEEEQVVVHYDAETEEGFFYVPKGPHDTDIIRKPPHKTTRQPNRDSE